MTTDAWQIRPWQPGDSAAALTALLHAAYAPLAEAGLNFTAASQTEAMTAKRLAGGHGLVAVLGDALLGTITVSSAFDANHQPWARATPWFYRSDVAHLHQFAVAPGAQRSGVGRALLQAAEAWAQAAGHRAIALDTALPALHLQQRYRRAGYVEVAQVQWAGKSYRSAVMLKILGDVSEKPVLATPVLATPVSTTPVLTTPVLTTSPTDLDAEHHAATVRCLWAHVQARDWPGARALLADNATLYWRASGEHLLDADAIIRVNAIYPEGWQLRILDVTPMQDGRVHSMIEVRHAGQRFIAHTLWRFAGRLIVQADETWATAEPPPAWRTAEAIGAYRRDPPEPAHP